MSDLATVDDLALLLGLTETQADLAEDLLTQLLDSAEALFESETGRLGLPFQAAQTGRIEILRAPRSANLWLEYPIAQVSKVAMGLDVEAPTETLDPTDAAQLVWRAGQRLLERTDGRGWSGWCATRFVKVTYDAQADLPEDAKAAVLRLAAAMWGTKGNLNAGLASETLDNYSATYVNQSMFADAARQDPAWVIAVARHRRFTAI